MKKFIPIFLLIIIFSIPQQPLAHASILAQTGAITIDNTNARMGCTTHSFIYRQDAGEHELTMILLTSSPILDDPNPVQFSYTFNFDQGTITGNLMGSFYEEEDFDAYDSSELFAEISNGTVTWDSEQGVWMFGGDVQMEVYLDMLNKTGSVGDEIFYGEAHTKTTVTGKIVGASGDYRGLDHHGEMADMWPEFRIQFEGRDLTGEGAGEISFLSVECYLDLPHPQTLEELFPAGLGVNPPGGETDNTENNDQSSGADDEFDLANPNDQLGLFIATYGTDWTMLNQWPGWENLTPTQQINLQNLITRLDHILALEAPVSPLGLALLEDEKREEIKAQQAADLIEEELEIRKNIRDAIWLETLGETFGQEAVELYQYFGLFQNIKGLYDSGVAWIEKIKDPDAASIDKVKQDAIKNAGIDKTPEDIAREAITHINTLATATSAYHFAYYCENVRANTGPNAHFDAMNALRTRVNDFVAGEIGDPNNKLEQIVWGPGAGRALKENGIYDRAFQKLNCDNPPLVKP